MPTLINDPPFVHPAWTAPDPFSLLVWQGKAATLGCHFWTSAVTDLRDIGPFVLFDLLDRRIRGRFYATTVDEPLSVLGPCARKIGYGLSQFAYLLLLLTSHPRRMHYLGGGGIAAAYKIPSPISGGDIDTFYGRMTEHATIGGAASERFFGDREVFVGTPRNAEPLLRGIAAPDYNGGLTLLARIGPLTPADMPDIECVTGSMAGYRHPPASTQAG